MHRHADDERVRPPFGDQFADLCEAIFAAAIAR